jgi:ATP-dependent RNA helicase RhlE
LDLGFIKDIRDVIRFLPKKRQTLFFSATIDEKIKKLAYSLVKKPIRIQVSPKDPVSKNVDHMVTFVEMDDKRFFLERLVKENPSTKILVFVRTKVRAERVKKAMERVNIESLTIHGDVEQNKRLNVMNKFKNGEVKMLIATDVSARGIDIPNVGYVVNYDLPEQPENYVHRVGRTGRGKKRGNAISFCSSGEKVLLDEIQELIHNPISVLEIGKDAYLETIDFSEDRSKSLKELLNEVEEVMSKKKKRKK